MYVVGALAGGLAGCKPAKNRSFLLVVAGEAGNHQQKKAEIGAAEPRPTTA
jgi:hypothetical protein